MAIYTDCAFTPPTVPIIVPLTLSAGAAISHRGTVTISGGGGSYCNECTAINSKGQSVPGVYVITGGTSACEPCVATDGADGAPGGGSGDATGAHLRCKCSVTGHLTVDRAKRWCNSTSTKNEAAAGTVMNVVGTKTIAYQVDEPEFIEAQRNGTSVGVFDQLTGLGWVSQEVVVNASSRFDTNKGEMYEATVEIECCDKYTATIVPAGGYRETATPSEEYETPERTSQYPCDALVEMGSLGIWDIERKLGYSRHPFKVHLNDEERASTGGIDPESFLYDGWTGNEVSITGLLDSLPGISSGGGCNNGSWFTMQSGNVYLEITFDNFRADVAEIKSYPSGVVKEKIEISGGKQKKCNLLIAKITQASNQNGDSTFIVNQCVSSNLSLIYNTINGVLCRVPIPV